MEATKAMADWIPGSREYEAMTKAAVRYSETHSPEDAEAYIAAKQALSAIQSQLLSEADMMRLFLSKWEEGR